MVYFNDLMLLESLPPWTFPLGTVMKPPIWEKSPRLCSVATSSVLRLLKKAC